MILTTAIVVFAALVIVAVAFGAGYRHGLLTGAALGKLMDIRQEAYLSGVRDGQDSIVAQLRAQQESEETIPSVHVEGLDA